MIDEFVDRNNESSAILKIVENCAINTIIITASKSGVGKSTLSKKVLFQLPESVVPVLVKTFPINTNQHKAENEYLSLLFKALYSLYNNQNSSQSRKSKKLTFKYFIKHEYNRDLYHSINKNALENMLSHTSNKRQLITLGAVLLLKKAFGIDYYDFEKSALSDSSQAIVVQREYIKYLLGTQRHCICIENIQNMDNHSFSHLEKILCDTLDKRIIFILEYTLNDSETLENPIKLRDSLLQTGANALIYKLDNMCAEYAFKAIRNKYPDIDRIKESFISFYNKSANGNIRKMEDYVLCDTHENTSIDFDPAIDNITKLSNSSKLLMAIISIHSGKVSMGCVHEVYKQNLHMLSQGLQDCLLELTDVYKLAIVNNGYLTINHASITDAWDNYAKEHPIHMILAYNSLEVYYKTLLKNNADQQPETVLLLLSMYFNFEPIKIYDMIPLLKATVLNSISAKNAGMYILKFIKSIENKLGYYISLLYEIINWCCDLDLILEASLILSMIEKDINLIKNINYYYCFCRVNYMLGNYDKVISCAEGNIPLTQSKEEALYYYLFLIISYRSTNEYGKMRRIVDIIEKDESYTSLSPYGLFLRLAEVYEQKDLCSEKIKKSIDYFKDKCMPQQIAKSNIALSYIYAINGQTKEADHALNSALETIESQNILSYIFKVNKACIKMLEGNFSTEILNLLDSAELMVENDFAQLAIINNKIICCIEGLNTQQSKFLELKAIELLKRVPDKHMHAILYYNLYVLNRFTNSEKATAYYKQAKSNCEYCHTLSVRMGISEQENRVTSFLLTKPWHVCFLSCWDFDFILD